MRTYIKSPGIHSVSRGQTWSVPICNTGEYITWTSQVGAAEKVPGVQEQNEV